VRIWPVDDRPDEAARLVVEIDQALAENGAVEEGDDPVRSVEAGVKREARHEALMQPAPVTNGGPDPLGTCVDQGVCGGSSRRFGAAAYRGPRSAEVGRWCT
jgi:hypothetical protein